MNTSDLTFPEIIVLCGSTRFYDEFQKTNYELTMQGKIVLSVGFYPHAKAKSGHGEGVGHDSVEKVTLDELHKRKIDLADRVYVLNVGGYIGTSTRSEIEYALANDKPIDYLEPLKEDTRTLTVFVEGHETVVLVYNNLPLYTVIPNALLQAGYCSPPPGNWDLRDDNGYLFLMEANIGQWNFPDDTKLFLTKKPGVGS